MIEELLGSVRSCRWVEADGRRFYILRKEGNMSELADEQGRKWAWPVNALVRVELSHGEILPPKNGKAF